MADDLANILRLNKAHVKPAAEVLARAFYDYPMSVYFMPDEATRKKEQPAVFRTLMRSGIKNGEVYATSPQMEGVAVWYSPDSRQESFWSRLTGGQFIFQWLAGGIVMARQRAFAEYAAEVRRRVVSPRHWYLQLLGVDPAYHGKGYSSRLLRPILARADREGVPCYLDTQAEKNVALYEHFGFRVAEEGIIPGSNMKSWAMVREK